MNETEIKTQLGLILQGVLAEALSKAGYSYVMDPQYDPTCEKPDFLIPDDKNPQFMIEVHQTEARNSFQMKTLRTFTAVTEAKAFYKNDLVCINILFGNPDIELPAANVKAMCSFFDENILPRKQIAHSSAIIDLETKALELAGTVGTTVKEATDYLIAHHVAAITELSNLLHPIFRKAKARTELFPLWIMERKRTKTIKEAPATGNATYYKRMILRALYLKDEDFQELVDKQAPALCSKSVQDQLLETGLAEIREDLDGDYFEMEPEFQRFIADSDAPRLRLLCKARLDASSQMRWFFEDIRDSSRRKNMAKQFCDTVCLSESQFRSDFKHCFENGSLFGIEHTRCWIADLMPIVVGESHNYFNKAMFSSKKYTLKLGNPFNNITIRSDRLGKNSSNLKIYQEVACDIFFQTVSQKKIDLYKINKENLATQLLLFRLGAAIKLQKLDPLFLIAEETCNRYGLRQTEVSIPSIVGDLSTSSSAGKFQAYEISDGSGKKIMMNAVAVHDNNGDHKSKEWGARRLATLYRWSNKNFTSGEYSDALFILDGEWKDKDVERLHRDGWNHICRLNTLEDELIKIFQLPKAGELKN
jgi:hypothetical protein